MAIEPLWKNVSSYTVFIAGAPEWLSSSADYVFFLSFFSLHFQGQLKVVHKPLPWFPRYWHWAQFCYAWATEFPPPHPPIYHVWSRTSLQFVDKEAADVAALLMRAESKSDTCQPRTSPQKRRRRVETTYIWWGGVRWMNVSPQPNIMQVVLFFVSLRPSPRPPPPLFQNCMPSVELNPRY